MNKLDNLYKIINLLLHLSPECVDYKTTTEQKVIEDFVNSFSKQSIAVTLKEGKEVLAMDPFPWEWIEQMMYTAFNDEEDAKNTLIDILKMLEAEAKKQGKL